MKSAGTREAVFGLAVQLEGRKTEPWCSCALQVQMPQCRWCVSHCRPTAWRRRPPALIECLILEPAAECKIPGGVFGSPPVLW